LFTCSDYRLKGFIYFRIALFGRTIAYFPSL
jgi:hypothetical protein